MIYMKVGGGYHPKGRKGSRLLMQVLIDTIGCGCGADIHRNERVSILYEIGIGISALYEMDGHDVAMA